MSTEFTLLTILILLVHGKVITELKALEILASVQAVTLGAGDIGGSEGSVVIAVSGEVDDVERIFGLIKEIKGEPSVQELNGIVQHVLTLVTILFLSKFCLTTD